MEVFEKTTKRTWPANDTSKAMVLGLFLVWCLVVGSGLSMIAGVRASQQNGIKNSARFGSGIITLHLLSETQFHFKEQIQDWQNLLFRGEYSAVDFQHYLESFQKEEKDVQEYLARAQRQLAKLDISADIRARMVHFKENHLKMGEHYRKALESFDPTYPESSHAADVVARGAYKASAVTMEEVLDGMVSHMKHVAASTLKDTQDTYHKIFWSMVFMWGFVAILVIPACFFALVWYVKRVAESNLSAERANQSKTAFLASIKHEIQRPLTLLNQALACLETKKMAPKAKKQANIAHLYGTRLMAIVNDIFDYSKIKTQDFKLDHVEFNLEVLFHEVIHALTPAAEEKQIELTAHFPKAWPYLVRGDAQHLRFILLNLVGNSIRFTPEGGGIDLLCHPLAKEGDHVEFSFEVRDDGLPMEQRSYLFEGLAYPEDDKEKPLDVRGLGLAVCRHLVTMMGGVMDAAKNPFNSSGSGVLCHFTVKLDLRKKREDLAVHEALHKEVIIVGCQGAQLAQAEDCLKRNNTRSDNVYEVETAIQMIHKSIEVGLPYSLVILNPVSLLDWITKCRAWTQCRAWTSALPHDPFAPGWQNKMGTACLSSDLLCHS